MRFFASLLAALSLLCCALPVQAAIGTPTNIGLITGTTSATAAIVTTAAGVAGDTFVVLIGNNNNRTIVSVADSAGNNYTVVAGGVTATSHRAAFAYLYLTAPIPISTTVTITFSGVCAKVARVLKVSGLNAAAPYSAIGTASTGTGTAVTASFTPATADQLLIGAIIDEGGSADGNWTNDAAWTAVASQQNGSTDRYGWSTKIVASVSPVTKSDTLAVSRPWLSQIIGFKGESFIPPPPPSPYASRLRMARTAALSGGPFAYSATPYATWAQTAAIPARGNPADYGYDLPVIALNTTVPYQTYTTTTRIGALAYHAPTNDDVTNGLYSNIDYATVSVDGGRPVRVSEETLNPDTGTVDWNVELNPSLFTDGPHEARWTFYPTTGTPYTLQGGYRLVFNTNFLGGMAPVVTYYADATIGDNSRDCTDATIAHVCLTIDRVKNAINTTQGGTAGGTIKLAAGSYVYGAASETTTSAATPRWMVITPQDGVATGDVIITGSGSSGQGLKTPYVRFTNMKITGSIDSFSGVSVAHWSDHSIIELAGRTSACSVANYCIGFMSYLTDGSFSNARFGPVGAAIVRSIAVNNIGEDVVSSSQLVDNVTVTNVSNSGTSPQAHPDVYQFNGSASNQIIIRNLTASYNIGAQGYFEDNDPTTASNIAVINSVFDNQTIAHSAEKVMQFGGPGYNWLWYNNTFVGATVWRTDFHFSADGLTFINTSWTQNPGCSPTYPGVKCITIP